ncbi:MAG: hypothetical protein MUC93_07650 [Bacteroidales bacterium]|jgi:hypothetical protein|nr:hypothetical protein [Bacteroidales bacterium]
MLKKLICLLIWIPATSSIYETACQVMDSNTFRIFTRSSFYSTERAGEMLLHIPQNHIYNNLTVLLKINNDSATSWVGKPVKRIVRIPLALNLQPGNYQIIAYISVPGSKLKYTASSSLTILKYKPNEVKTDRLTGGLIVNKRLFFPFGFYCYSPVYPTLPEEEVVKGFNMISPYQKILPETLMERKAYMDRCAELGMKVHFNLLSVSGGGGVGSKIEGLSDMQKKERLINEINTFKDHPALLAWYIADEPTGNNIAPDSLLKIYELIKRIDPWHPVSIVFMAPFSSAKKYSDALDIVMADPYPIPTSPVTIVGDVAGSLYKEFSGKRPLWIVPQAFGGSEWWEREPTLQELRSMTYQSIINGARGIQYFIRQGLNLFPKSTSSWGECGRMASEIAELTPWLLSDEEPVPVRSGTQNIIVTSAIHDGQLMIMAVNKTNSPQRAVFTISESFTGKAHVVFENRSITVSSGYFSDNISAFGSQVYMIGIRQKKETIKPWPDNLYVDPGFEDISSTGVPASCYARNGGDRGATYFLDSREHFEGNHSIRLVTPEENGSVKLRFFPINGRNGATYLISVRAKADPEQGNVLKENYEDQEFEVSLGGLGVTRFTLSSDWQEYLTFVTIPYYNDQPPRTNIILHMSSAGTAWFDMLQVVECADIKRSINPELTGEW